MAIAVGLFPSGVKAGWRNAPGWFDRNLTALLLHRGNSGCRPLDMGCRRREEFQRLARIVQNQILKVLVVAHPVPGSAVHCTD